MRKELFKHEITLLRDTFGRLLRRHAETNLIKLIKKTHPADLAIIFRYFNDDEQIQVFDLMSSSNHTLEFLIELDDTIIEKLLDKENVDRIAELIQNASTNDQSYILGTLNQSQAKSVIDLLKKDRLICSKIPNKKMDSIFKYSKHLKNINYIFKRVFK